MSDALTLARLEELDRSRVIARFRRRGRGCWEDFVEESVTVAEARGYAREDDGRVKPWGVGELKFVGVTGTISQIDAANPNVYDGIMERLTAATEQSERNGGDEDVGVTREAMDRFNALCREANKNSTTGPDGVEIAPLGPTEPPTGQCRHCRFAKERPHDYGCWVAEFLTIDGNNDWARGRVEALLKRLAELTECPDFSPGKRSDDEELVVDLWLSV